MYRMRLSDSMKMCSWSSVEMILWSGFQSSAGLELFRSLRWTKSFFRSCQWSEGTRLRDGDLSVARLDLCIDIGFTKTSGYEALQGQPTTFGVTAWGEPRTHHTATTLGKITDKVSKSIPWQRQKIFRLFRSGS